MVQTIDIRKSIEQAVGDVQQYFTKSLNLVHNFKTYDKPGFEKQLQAEAAILDIQNTDLSDPIRKPVYIDRLGNEYDYIRFDGYNSKGLIWITSSWQFDLLELVSRGPLLTDNTIAAIKEAIKYGIPYRIFYCDKNGDVARMNFSIKFIRNPNRTIVNSHHIDDKSLDLSNTFNCGVKLG